MFLNRDENRSTALFWFGICHDEVWTYSATFFPFFFFK